MGRVRLPCPKISGHGIRARPLSRSPPGGPFCRSTVKHGTWVDRRWTSSTTWPLQIDPPMSSGFGLRVDCHHQVGVQRASVKSGKPENLAARFRTTHSRSEEPHEPFRDRGRLPADDTRWRAESGYHPSNRSITPFSTTLTSNFLWSITSRRQFVKSVFTKLIYYLIRPHRVVTGSTSNLRRDISSRSSYWQSARTHLNGWRSMATLSA